MCAGVLVDRVSFRDGILGFAKMAVHVNHLGEQPGGGG